MKHGWVGSDVWVLKFWPSLTSRLIVKYRTPLTCINLHKYWPASQQEECSIIYNTIMTHYDTLGHFNHCKVMQLVTWTNWTTKPGWRHSGLRDLHGDDLKKDHGEATAVKLHAQNSTELQLDDNRQMTNTVQQHSAATIADAVFCARGPIDLWWKSGSFFAEPSRLVVLQAPKAPLGFFQLFPATAPWPKEQRPQIWDFKAARTLHATCSGSSSKRSRPWRYSSRTWSGS